MAVRKFLFLNSSEGFAQEQGATDELSVAKLSLTGIEGIALDAGAAKLTNLAEPTSNSDAATKLYVDGKIATSASGFTVKAPVKAIVRDDNATLSGVSAIDGVSISAGDRVLVARPTPNADCGIYVAAAGSWTRATDLDASAETVDGVTVFVEQGTVYKNTTWVLITDNPITLDSTALEFTQFAGIADMVAGNGLDKTGNTLSVNVGNGLAISSDNVVVSLASNFPALTFTDGKLDVVADATRGLAKDANGAYVKLDTAYGLAMDPSGIRIDLASGKGLEFDGSGDLAVKLETDGGIQFDAVNGGLEIDVVSADRLSTSASGLDVVGVPAQFKINGSAVSANVTAANLTALTNSNPLALTTLHYHAPPQYVQNVGRFVSGNITAGSAVYVNPSNNSYETATCNGTAAQARVLGLSQSSTGSITLLVSEGNMQMSGYGSLVVGTPYYLGSSGTPVEYASVPAGARVIRLGFATSSSSMQVAIQDMGQKA